MSEQPSGTMALVKLHTSLWWTIIIWFAVVTIFLVLELDTAVTLSTVGLGLIYIGTLARLIQLGVLFRRLGRSRPLLLSGVLTLLLIATVLMRYILK